MPTGNRRRVLASQVKDNTGKGNDHIKKAATPKSSERRLPTVNKHSRHADAYDREHQFHQDPSDTGNAQQYHPENGPRVPTGPRTMQAFAHDGQRVFSPGLDLVNGHFPPDPMNYTWQRWPNVKVLVRFPGPESDMRGIFEVFSQYGFIGRIGIDRSSLSATILFVPPPSEPFWLTSILRVRTGSKPWMVGLLLNKPPSVPSPFNTDVTYPSFLNIYVEELAFGVTTAETTMMQMLTLRNKGVNDILIQLNMKKRELDIRFHFPVPLEEDYPNLGRFRVPLRDMRAALCIDMGEYCAFVMNLASPPDFYSQLNSRDIDFATNPWNEWSSWTRQTELVNPEFAEEHQRSPLRMRVEHAVIDYGRWLSYRFIVSSSKQFKYMLKILEDFNIRVQRLDPSDFTFLARKDASIWSHLELPSTHPSIRGNAGSGTTSGMSEMRSGISHLPFPILWQLMVCISRGYLNEFNMTQEFLQKLNEVGLETAKGLLERVADCKLRFHDPMQIFSQVKVSGKTKRIPPYCSLLYSCNITPTTIVFSSPVVEISNRVIRKNSEYQDRFLRVRFTEENFGRIHSQTNSVNEELFVRIRRFLKHGLVLGDRHYEFLAFGNSQFREHGLYAFASIKGLAEIPDMTANDIRSQLGNFDHIRVPAKWCARLGQNFSTTRAFPTTVNVNGRIPDIEHHGYNFSDGVGKMSSFVASMVGMEFGRSPDQSPSVVQFRLGGCKGILAVSPHLPSREVQIRESQSKFDSPNTGLEIIRVSQFVSVTLNRQIIVVLSTLGVEDKSFTHMLRNMLVDLETAMVDKDTACRLLSKHIDLNHITLTMVNMIMDGFMSAQEPFILSLLRLWRSWLIKNLKDKARIFVEDGACLFGTVDEYSVLRGHFDANTPTSNSSREDIVNSLPEVFVQVDSERSGRYRVLDQVCMIARNPSLHPGDIRIVRAVDKAELRHMKDVLVLPQTGDRDLGSMCSGGDLDGDDYLVIWDQSLLPPIEQWNQTAMDFSPHPPQPLNRPVTVEDISDFFVQYIKNDQLPTIALAHLCWADRMVDGVRNPKCLQLAQLHSHAVDYPKNGVPAQMTRDLRPDQWPHFMESQHRSAEQIYTSKAVLGQLYDMIERVDFVPALDKAFDARILNAFHVPASLLFTASEIKHEYDTTIRRIMAQLSIATEFEVFTAFAMAFNKEKKDYTLAEELGAIMQSHKNRFREVCADAAGGRTYDDLGPFLVAMYAVTQKEVAASKIDAPVSETHSTVDASLDQLPLISFPWIFAAELGNIATGRYRNEDIISVMMPMELPHRRNKRKAGSALRQDALGSSVESTEQLDIPILEISTEAEQFLSLDDFMAQDTTSNVLPTVIKLSPIPQDSAAILALSNRDTARDRNLLRAASISRPESPMSLHPSEGTARDSTPPSSQGGHEDSEDNCQAEETEEEEFHVVEDTSVTQTLSEKLDALLQM